MPEKNLNQKQKEFSKEKIVGIWSLASLEVTDENGQKTYPLGEDATGFIMYHPEGYMSAQIMQSGRPQYTSGEVLSGTQEEMAAASNGYLAYAGPYQVDEINKMVTHHMTVSLCPNWLGNTQPRYLDIKGDTLEITSQPVFFNGKEHNTKLIWKRVS
ncbi:lipocalin-like domain-containing protein [Priestia megaterium]|uniref:lipocalin-like domain-containing protein n=1 Tax=Priestia megaterium TaxID=1404 RepID=UPI000BFD58E6|nr:lipocalin-like domain-containing protein [Priestia megaterium]PGX73997.1 hypothetical protein COE31_20940 [Priestia megaterium]